MDPGGVNFASCCACIGGVDVEARGDFPELSTVIGLVEASRTGEAYRATSPDSRGSRFGDVGVGIEASRGLVVEDVADDADAEALGGDESGERLLGTEAGPLLLLTVDVLDTEPGPDGGIVVTGE